MLDYENDDTSDTDSLPDISQHFKAQSSTISKDDIVWAKFKHLYWPALVRAIYPKQKKISIWYADEPGKTFKLPYRNVHLFHDTVIGNKIREEVRKAGCLREHEGLTSHALKYKIRQLEGYNDDPRKYFDQTYPFFLIEEWKKQNPGADISNIKIPPLYISHEKKQSIRKTIFSFENESSDSEVESTDSENLPDDQTLTTDYVAKINMHMQIDSSDASRGNYVDKIVECILSGTAEKHLQKVILKRIPSEYRDRYEKSLKCKKKDISCTTYTGPIEEDALLRKIIFYLLPLYDKICNVHKQKKCAFRKFKSSRSPLPLFPKTITKAQYVASVWLPESIIFAISVVENVPVDEARQLFAEKASFKTKRIEKILASLDIISSESNDSGCIMTKPSKLIINQNYNKDEHKTAGELNDVEMCSSAKQVCVKNFGTLKCDSEPATHSSNIEVKSENECSDKILDFILSGKADAHLQKIMSNTISSNYCNIYKLSPTHNSCINYAGLAKDYYKLKKIVLYLCQLFCKMHSVIDKGNFCAVRKRKCKSSASLFNEDFKTQFVVLVWLPEAIIFAISVIENVSLPEAEKRFNDKPVFHKKSQKNVMAVQDMLISELSKTNWSTSSEVNVPQNCNVYVSENRSGDSEKCYLMRNTSEKLKVDGDATKHAKFSLNPVVSLVKCNLNVEYDNNHTKSDEAENFTISKTFKPNYETISSDNICKRVPRRCKFNK